MTRGLSQENFHVVAGAMQEAQDLLRQVDDLARIIAARLHISANTNNQQYNRIEQAIYSGHTARELCNELGIEVGRVKQIRIYERTPGLRRKARA